MADVKISQLPAATTPLSGPEQLPLVQGGVTKQVTVSGMLTDANLGTPTVIDLANATSVPVAEAVGVLPVVNGGTGITNPSLVAGTNVSVTGTWPNQTINASAVVESVTGTAPVVSSGGANPAISMAAATGSVNGYLTSTDWTTFNNKVTPGGALGTPSSGTATNLTGLPLTTGVTGVLPIANGGTNASTAPNARGNILPTYSGNAGKVLAVNPGATDVEYISIGGVGTVTSVGTGTGLTGGPITAAGTIALADTAVTPGAYTSANITVDAQGRITAAASGSSATGTVTDVSVVSANGLAGTVATSTSTPAITLSTTVTGLVKGNGTALSAATAGTDYVEPGGALGTPSSGTLTNTTGLPLSTGVTGTLPIANGGTSQTTAAAAITALTGAQTSGHYLRSDGTNAALGAIQAADVPTLNQNTTGTAAGLSTTLAITSGGTGQTTANAAFNALVPSQTGNSGKFLTTDGTDTSWATNPAGTVTSVGGTGTVNGISLSGTVTSSGNLTLGGTLSGVDLTTQVTGTLPVANGGTGATTLTGIVKGNGTSAFSAATAGTDYVAPATATTFTATQTFNGSSSVFGAVLLNAAETVNYGASSAPTSTTLLYVNSGSVVYFGGNSTTNWTTNFTFSSGTSLNTAMSIGQSLTMAVLVTNGGTAYYNTSVQVDGTTSGVTTKWQGGTAPTSGNASAIDVYTYTIIKTASATYTVLASQTKFA